MCNESEILLGAVPKWCWRDNQAQNVCLCCFFPSQIGPFNHMHYTDCSYCRKRSVCVCTALHTLTCAGTGRGGDDNDIDAAAADNDDDEVWL